MISRLVNSTTASIFAKFKNVPAILYQDLSTLLKIMLFFSPYAEANTIYFSSADNSAHYKLEFGDGVINVTNCTTIPTNATVSSYELIPGWSKPTISSAQLYRGVGEQIKQTLEDCVAALVKEFVTEAHNRENARNEYIGSIIGYCALAFMVGCMITVISWEAIKNHRKKQKQAVAEKPSSPEAPPITETLIFAPTVNSDSSEVSTPSQSDDESDDDFSSSSSVVPPPASETDSMVSTPSQSEREEANASSPKLFVVPKGIPNQAKEIKSEEKKQRQLN